MTTPASSSKTRESESKMAPPSSSTVDHAKPSATDLARKIVEAQSNGSTEKPETTQIPAYKETSKIVGQVKDALGFRSKIEALKQIVDVGSALLLEQKRS